jgi:hypothetical protein
VELLYAFTAMGLIKHRENFVIYEEPERDIRNKYDFAGGLTVLSFLG